MTETAHPPCPKGYRVLQEGEIVKEGDLTLQRDGSLRHPFGVNWHVQADQVGRYIRPYGRTDSRRTRR